MEISDILRLVEQEREDAEVAKLLNFNRRRQSGSSSNFNTNYSRSSSTTSSEGAKDEQPSSSSAVFMAPLSPISRPSKIKVGSDPNPSSSGMSNLEIVRKIISMPVGDIFSQGMQLTPEERAIEERNIIDMKRLQIEIETGGDFSVGDNLDEILCFGRVLSGYNESGVFGSRSGGESKFPGMRIKNQDLNLETSSPIAGNRKSKKKNKSKPKPTAKSLQHSTSEKHPVTTGIPPNSSRVMTETVQYQQDQNGGRYQSAKRKSAVGGSQKGGKQSKDIIMIEKTEMSHQSSSELLIQSIQRAIDKANADFKTPEEVLPVPVHLRDNLGIFKLTGNVSEQNVAETAEIPSSDKFEYPHCFAEAEVLDAIPGPHVEDKSIVLPYRSVAVAMLEVTDTGMGSFVAWNEFEVELQTIVDEINYHASKIDDLFGEMDAYFSRTINDLDLLI